jgi:WD40 repeat protein
VKGGPQTWDEKPVIVKSACLSLDGTRIAAVFADGTLCIYDASTGEVILPFPLLKVDENPRSVIFSRNGKLVATGGQALRLWKVQTGEEVESFDIDVTVYSLAFSPDDTCIAAGCAGRSIIGDGGYNLRVIDLELAKISHFHPYGFTGIPIKLLKGEVWPSPFEGHVNQVTAVAYSPNGNQIVSSSDDFTVRVWDVSNGSRRTFRVGTTHSVAFSPNGTQIASDNTLINLSTDSFTSLGDVPANSLAFSVGGTGGFIASGSLNGACQILDASTHQTILQLVGHRGGVHSVSFFPNGKQIMSASEDGTIRVWDVELLKERGEMDRWQMDRDGDGYWFLGPEEQHLFWAQPPFRHARNTLVIGRCPEIDFSNFVHGDEWVKCREPLCRP